MVRRRQTDTGVTLLDKHRACVTLAKDRRLCRSALSVGIFLLDAFNTKTGRCDWAIPNIAAELNMGRRPVFTALDKLHECGYLDWQRHAGAHGTNAYHWIWKALLDVVQDESEEETKRVQEGAKSGTSYMPNPALRGAKSGTQNLKETFNETLNQPTHQKNARQKNRAPVDTEPTRQPYQRPLLHLLKFDTPASADVRKQKAEERWQQDFNKEFQGQGTENYGTALEALTPQLQEVATAAEMKSTGAGLQFILDKLANNSGRLAKCL